MSYTLTLTAAERQAIDWVGGRYAHGHELFQLLYGRCPIEQEHCDWWSLGDLTFQVPEHVAWQIAEMGREGDYRWDCLADELSAKLTDFCLAIV